MQFENKNIFHNQIFGEENSIKKEKIENIRIAWK